MDDIKSPGFKFFFGFHFTDYAINNEPIFANSSEVSQINNSILMANKAKEAVEGYQKTAPKIYLEEAYFLRMMLHVVGDIHQPLHNSNFFNSTFPTGDYGGNMIKIKILNNTEMNLHAYLDSGATNLKEYKRPFTPETRKEVEEFAKVLMGKYKFEENQLKGKPEQWVKESYTLARDAVYPFWETNKAVTQQYHDQIVEITESQIVLGGLRLAEFILDIFAKKS